MRSHRGPQWLGIFLADCSIENKIHSQILSLSQTHGPHLASLAATSEVLMVTASFHCQSLMSGWQNISSNLRDVKSDFSISCWQSCSYPGPVWCSPLAAAPGTAQSDVTPPTWLWRHFWLTAYMPSSFSFCQFLALRSSLRPMFTTLTLQVCRLLVFGLWLAVCVLCLSLTFCN